MKIKKQLILLISIALIYTNSSLLFGQSSFAITIDDVPYFSKYQKDSLNSKLLKQLDSLNIPITIFITENLLYNEGKVQEKTLLLENWMKRNYITLGYHGCNHLKYSEISLDSFKIDFEKGEKTILKLAEKHNKSVDYYRFPYNDLGKDSAQHASVEKYLASKKYIIAPFTVESADWAYNFVYEYYLDKNDTAKAKQIGTEYISKTLEYFKYMDSLSINKYGRLINQIYLCHDITINADYLPTLINELKIRNHKIISFPDALKDNSYAQKDNYKEKWGISWLYRWMKNKEDIKFYKKKEPKDDIYPLYKQLYNEQNPQN